jgi:hypothetical protein
VTGSVPSATAQREPSYFQWSPLARGLREAARGPGKAGVPGQWVPQDGHGFE